jgi:hypothetical protein
MWYNGFIKSARFLRAPRAMPPRHVVLLTLQKLHVCPGLLVERSICSVQRMPPRGGKIHCPLRTIVLSPLTATLMDPLANVANKRLAALAKPFSCNNYKKRRVGVPPFRTRHSSFITRHRSQVLCFQTLAHSFALFCISGKLNPFLFNRFRTLCPKTPGVGEDRKCF